MSAYLCDVAHIGGLARWAHENAPESYTDPAALARLLATENLRSVAYRYPDDAEGDRPGQPCKSDADYIRLCEAAARFIGAARGVKPYEVVKAIECYQYQSCEHPDWDGSHARAVVEQIRDLAERLRHPDDPTDSTGWGWPERVGGVEQPDVEELPF